MWSEIVAIYRASKKSNDINWFTANIARPPAALVVYLAQRTRITPNQITFLSVVVASAACGLWIAVPGYAALVAGALIFELSFVLDCADGQLARLRKQASPIGHLLDFLMDELKAMLVLASISVRLWLESGDERLLVLGLAGLFCLAAGISLTTFTRRPEYAGPPSTPSTPQAPASKGPMALVMAVARFFVHYPQYIWICAVAGRIDVFFWAYLAVNALYFAKTFAGVVLRLGRFAPPQPTPSQPAATTPQEPTP